jgi:hypothetical protein
MQDSLSSLLKEKAVVVCQIQWFRCSTPECEVAIADDRGESR